MYEMVCDSDGLSMKKVNGMWVPAYEAQDLGMYCDEDSIDWSETDRMGGEAD